MKRNIEYKVKTYQIYMTWLKNINQEQKMFQIKKENLENP